MKYVIFFITTVTTTAPHAYEYFESPQPSISIDVVDPYPDPYGRSQAQIQNQLLKKQIQLQEQMFYQQQRQQQAAAYERLLRLTMPK